MTKQNEREIVISDASIKTTAIEVKVIKIDNRQMTLAVFRQLQQWRIIDRNTGELQGTPWGWVNYHPDDCGDPGKAEHIHVIWQKEGKLYQSRTPASHVFGLDKPGWATEEQILTYYRSYAQLKLLDQLFIAV